MEAKGPCIKRCDWGQVFSNAAQHSVPVRYMATKLLARGGGGGRFALCNDSVGVLSSHSSTQGIESMYSFSLS